VTVAFLVRSLGCGGAERQLTLLAGRLAQRHAVTILTFYDGDDFFLPDAPAKLVALGKRGRWDVLRFVRRFRAEIRRIRPDVVYAFMNTAGLLALAAPRSANGPAIAWGIRSSNMDLRRYGLVPRALRRLEAALSRWSDVAIANSEAGRREALADGFHTRIVVVPNGIDTARFRPDAAGGRARREEWGIPAGATVIGIVGRHDPMKGYEVFLKAAARYALADRTARYVLIGSGPVSYTSQLKRLVAQLALEDRVIWAGQTTDMPSCYSGMDLFTSASLFGEGFSNAVAEAMACGAPCVVTNVGDAPSIVGDLGVVVPPDAPDALAAAWSSTLADASRMGPDAGDLRRARIVERFSDAAMVRRSEAVLEEVVARRQTAQPAARRLIH